MHHKAVVEINKVPTVIETWGRWIEETPTKNENIVLCIPGNPGVTTYYRQFLETLHEKLQCPVWVIGHAGHQIINNKNIRVPTMKGNEKLYDVQGQTDHKLEFFRKYIPTNARVFLIGHSVGAYISLNLLKHQDIKSRVVKSYFLFPTIEDMEQTSNGQFLTRIIYYFTYVIFFLSWIFTLFPEGLQTFLIYGYFKLVMGVPSSSIPATIELIHPAVLNKVFYMAYDEMNLVGTLDRSLIEPHMDKIKLYYAPNDNWAPAKYYHGLVEKFPDINAELCVREFEHAFVLKQSTDVAMMVAGWIESDI